MATPAKGSVFHQWTGHLPIALRGLDQEREGLWSKILHSASAGHCRLWHKKKRGEGWMLAALAIRAPVGGAPGRCHTSPAFLVPFSLTSGPDAVGMPPPMAVQLPQSSALSFRASADTEGRSGSSDVTCRPLMAKGREECSGRAPSKAGLAGHLLRVRNRNPGRGTGCCPTVCLPPISSPVACPLSPPRMSHSETEVLCLYLK